MWHNLDILKVSEKLITNINSGLSKKEVDIRLKKNGENKLKAVKKKNIFKKFFDQLNDFMIIILIFSAIISFFIGEKTDSAVIAVIVLVNSIIGVIQEGKAEKSIEAISKISMPKCKVIRNGIIQSIYSKELVMGDIVLLEAGDLVPADLRLCETVNLKIDEASFTGETVPIEKITGSINISKNQISDKKNMAFSSSLVTYGRGKGIVVETGMNTEIGKIAGYITKETKDISPLKKRLKDLGKKLGLIVIFICIVIFIIGITIYNMELFEIFLVSISLAVAAIPEGLPTTATIVLALGVQKMAKKNAVIRKLPSVETLGSTTVICSDKTGTLTENKMTVKKVYFENSIQEINRAKLNDTLQKLIHIATLCNDSKLVKDLGNYSVLGDPTEVALTNMAIHFKINKNTLEKTCERIFEIPFDSNRKMMSTVNGFNGKNLVCVKGSLEEVIKKSKYILKDQKEVELTKSEIDNIISSNELMSEDALRVLAFAYKEIGSEYSTSNLEEKLVFVGLVGMIDPPKQGVKDAIRICKKAGIKTVMITGDHLNTASVIAKNLGIINSKKEAITGEMLDKMNDREFVQNVTKYSVYARVSPEHKLKIIKALKKNRHIVAMTGDGVNDAPALKGADIGIAMGNIGTDVAKEASDMILVDDNFTTIVDAVKEGRRIFDNISKAIKFLLSCNIGEIFSIFFAMLMGYKEPLLPIHILWINLVTDTLPALALGVDRADEDIMERPPKKSGNKIFEKKDGFNIFFQGLIISIVTLTSFKIAINHSLEKAQTMAFLVLALSQIIHSITIHLNKKSVFSIKTFSNIYLLVAILVTTFLTFIVTEIPALREIFNFVSISKDEYIKIIFLSFVPMAIIEIFKKLKRFLPKVSFFKV